jgi:uncharacterized membrane protein
VHPSSDHLPVQLIILALIFGAALYLTNAAVVSLGASVTGSSVWWLTVAPIMLMHAGSGFWALGGADYYQNNYRRAALSCGVGSVVVTLGATAFAAVAALKFSPSWSPAVAGVVLFISQATAVVTFVFVIYFFRRSARR